IGWSRTSAGSDGTRTSYPALRIVSTSAGWASTRRDAAQSGSVSVATPRMIAIGSSVDAAWCAMPPAAARFAEKVAKRLFVDVPKSILEPALDRHSEGEA